MTKRNYRNERYTTDEGKKGVAKKSASKAKVSREAASTVYVKDTSKVRKSKKQIRYEEKVKESKRKAAEERRYTRVVGPGAAESIGSTTNRTQSKKYRRYWWVFLILAALAAVGAYFTQGTNFFYVCLVLSYGFIVVALVMEFWKIRKARNEEEKRAEQKLSTKRIKHEIEEQQKEADAKMLKRFNKNDELADELPFKE